MTPNNYETYLVPDPEALRDFAGIADEDALKEISTHIAMLGLNSANAAPTPRLERDERREYFRAQYELGFQTLAAKLLEYDVVIGCVPQLQILFLVRMAETCDPRNVKGFYSYEEFEKAEGTRGLMPLTPGVILNFGAFAGLYGETTEEEEESE